MPHEAGLIALKSVLVGKGTFQNTVSGGNATNTTGPWIHACASDLSTAIWDDNATRVAFAEALEQDCAPNAQMCQNVEKITQVKCRRHGRRELDALLGLLKCIFQKIPAHPEVAGGRGEQCFMSRSASNTFTPNSIQTLSSSVAPLSNRATNSEVCGGKSTSFSCADSPSLSIS